MYLQILSVDWDDVMEKQKKIEKDRKMKIKQAEEKKEGVNNDAMDEDTTSVV